MSQSGHIVETEVVNTPGGITERVEVKSGATSPDDNRLGTVRRRLKHVPQRPHGPNL